MKRYILFSTTVPPSLLIIRLQSLIILVEGNLMGLWIPQVLILKIEYTELEHVWITGLEKYCTGPKINFCNRFGDIFYCCS